MIAGTTEEHNHHEDAHAERVAVALSVRLDCLGWDQSRKTANESLAGNQYVLTKRLYGATFVLLTHTFQDFNVFRMGL